MEYNIDKKWFQRKSFLLLLLANCAVLWSCKKLVEIGPPPNTITTKQTFADSADANSGILGIYSNIIDQSPNIACGFEALYSSLSADELLIFNNQGDQFTPDILTPINGTITSQWAQSYSLLYQANASIEGLQASTGISANASNHFIGEAKFLRALIYFYLVNLFGNVPYITSSDYHTNALTATTPKTQIYDSIVDDLQYAQQNLTKDYSYSNGEKTRATYMSATALLARIYLYQGNWSQAASTASQIINDPEFSLNGDLDSVFLINSNEAILQWELNPEFGNYNATYEGIALMAGCQRCRPQYYLTTQLWNAFDSGDNRKVAWIDSTIYRGVTYYYPYKYKIGYSQQNPGQAATEYYMVLRLAEQYLIRAEAEANGVNGGTTAAIADLNTIRIRAGLGAYSGGADQGSVLNAIYHEWRIEFFAEWGHRWLDLKRLGLADSVLAPIKPQWQSYQQLYPIPQSDVNADPNLKQNPGY
jgi:starch-binding outer membrane protein, SusD/RagB family